MCLKFLLHVTRYSKSRAWVKKVRLTLLAMKAYRGSRSVAPLILNLGTIRRWVVIFTFQPLCPPEKDPPVSIEWEHVWPLEPNRTFWRREISYLCLGSNAGSPSAIALKLSQPVLGAGLQTSEIFLYALIFCAENRTCGACVSKPTCVRV
jgi:hypothetical protein